MHTIYIARSDNHMLRKTFRREDDTLVEDKNAFNPGANFHYEPRRCQSLSDVRDLLNELAEDSSRAVVMGRPANDYGARNSQSFSDTRTSLWWLDLDGIPNEGGAQATIERCLPFLVDHEYVYAFSQSSGLKQGLRCRVICETEGDLLADQYEHTRHYNGILCAFDGAKVNYLDTKIYSPSHLLFTSRPRLIEINDPHQVRAFLKEGAQGPVELEALPQLVDVTVADGYCRSQGLPALRGFGIEKGDSDHSIKALNAIGWLKAFMGEQWDDADERRNLWHEMLKNAGATAYEWQEYRDFIDRRAKDAREPPNQRIVKALPNYDKSILLDDAEKKLEIILQNFVQKTEPHVVAVNMTMGVGKTTELLRQVGIEYHNRQQHSPLNSFNVDFYAPTIALAEEAQAKAEKQFIPSFVEYGRKKSFGGVPVCVKADASEAIEGYVQSVAAHLCDDGEGNICPFFVGCRWQQQRTSFGDKWLRFRSHNYLGLPAVTDPEHPAFRPVDMVIIDESSFVSALTHVQWVAIKDLIAPRLKGDDYSWVLRFAKVIDEGLNLERLEAAGFTEEVFKGLITAEKDLRPSVAIDPSMSVEKSIEAVEGYDPGWHRFASVWRRLRDCLSTRSMNRVQATPDHLKLAWKSKIEGIPWDRKDDRPAVPVIILSGTMRREVIEQFIMVDEWHEIEVAPHPKAIIEQSDLRGSKAECLYGSTEKRRLEHKETDKEKIKSAEKIRRIVAGAGADRTTITFMDLAKQIGADGWFNAIAGRNDWEGRDLVVYGRPLAHFFDVEDEARAIFCDDPRPIQHLRGQWYPKRRVARRGDGFEEMEYHPDERVEAVRWLMCEGEIMQAVARSRYLRHPVKVLILNKTILPLRIDRVIQRYRVHPEWRSFEMARVVPNSEREMERLWPSLFSDRRTATRIRDARLEGAQDMLLIEYRRNRKAKWSKAWVVSLGAIHELGEVAEWQIADTPDNDIALMRREFLDFLAWTPMLVQDDEVVRPGNIFRDVTVTMAACRVTVKTGHVAVVPEGEFVIAPDDRIAVGQDRTGNDVLISGDAIPAPVPWPWRKVG